MKMSLAWLVAGLVLVQPAGSAASRPAHPYAPDASLEGTVLDAETNEPLPGANVTLRSPTWSAGAATDLDGHFLIAGLPTGRYRFEVSFVGYRSHLVDSLEITGENEPVIVRLMATGIEVNPITVTGSRRPERVLDAPAAVTVLEPRQLNARTALTAAEHLKDAPGVDLISTGIVSSRVVIRGFNDNLASSLLTLVDHRIARAPAVRLTALQLIPVSSGDIEQIEVVSGPASAMYGPNAANGVVHVLTRSPFESVGTSVSLAGGERNVFLGALRHAATYGSRLAYKVTAQYYSATDFEFFDPIETEARNAAIAAGALADTLKVGARDFDVDNLALTARLDYRFSSDLTLILNGGLTRGTNIEITPTGAAQVVGASLGYVQTRLLYRRFFAQAYTNVLNSGDSYFLRTGERFKDNSQLWVAQAQHYSDWGGSNRFTYGLDLFHTLPRGSGTVNGRNEDNDETTEIGAYLQSDTELHRKLNLSLAGRVDYHDRIGSTTFSPRAAIVYRPRSAHTVRLTYNRAFQTPKTNDLFSDIVGQRDVFQLGRLETELGFDTSTDLRVQGMREGFHFRRDESGRPYFRSPFAPMIGRGQSEWIAFDDQDFTRAMWEVARFATVNGLADNLAESGAIEPESADAISDALDHVLPQSVDGVSQTLGLLDLERQEFVPVGDIADFDRLRVTRTETIEAGYRGLVFGGLLVSVDGYRTRIHDLIGPFVVGTPNVFLEPSSLNARLRPSLAEALADPANAASAETLMELDRIPFLGNGNGSPLEEIAALVSTGIAGAIPFGTVSPEEAYDSNAVILMRRNFGEVTVYGVDFGLTLFLSRKTRVAANYAWVSDNYFRNVDAVTDVSLNAPRHKFGGMVQYETNGGRLETQVRWRLVDGYPVRSDIYVGRVERFGVVDASVAVQLPFIDDTRMMLTVQNLTDNRHREFVHVPEIGRLAILRVTHDL